MISQAVYHAASVKNQTTLDQTLLNIKCSIEICAEDTSQPEKRSNKKIKEVRELLNMTPVPYSLYLYRKELQRRKLHIVRLAQAKINLTDGLVCKTVKEFHGNKNFNCEMDILTREVMYKKKLQERISRIQNILNKKQAKQKLASQKECDKVEVAAVEVVQKIDNRDKFDFYN